MTHAALKDLLPMPETIATLTRIKVALPDVGVNGWAHGVRALESAIAALSAMEGDAFGWVVHGKYDGKPEWGPQVFFYYGEAGKISVEAHRQQGDKITPLYTAPPPQQAEKVTLDASQVTITEGDWTGTYSEWLHKHGIRPKDSCRLCDCTGDIHDQTGEWRGECPYCKPATHPTPSPEGKHRIAHTKNGASVGPPSPGPQGGGEYNWSAGEPPKWFDEWFIARTDTGDRVVLKRLPEEYTYDYTTADGTYFMAARMKSWMQFPDSQFKSLATPPAHQPGEVAKSRIVGMDCGSSDQTNYVIACPCGRLHGISAASSALAPKEAGHG